MAITAKLQFGDNSTGKYSSSYEVVDWRANFLTPHNNIRPEGDPRCESLEILLIAPNKWDLSLYEWFINGEYLSGRLLLDYSSTIRNKSYTDSDTQQVEFEDAQCYGLSEQYNINDQNRRTLLIKIAPTSITISDICIGNKE